ncbi:carbohydrate ABC transporter permease [Pseudoroseicyclus sp. H15]
MPLRLAHDHRRRTRLTYAAFLALPVILFSAVYIYPLLYSVAMSFHSWDGMSPSWTWVGFRNYISLTGDERFWVALGNNFRWLIFELVVPTALGLALALLLNERLRGASIYKTLIFLPFTMTPIAVAAFWRWIYDPSKGVAEDVLSAIGLGALQQNWLGDPDLVTYSIMFSSLWWKTGFSFLLYFAGLRAVPHEYIEAARIDGASAWTIFWRITFPMLFPTTIVVLGISGIDAMRVFDLVQGMTQGGPYNSSHVLATLMYDVSFQRFQMGLGAAIAVCLMLVAMIVVLPYIIYMSGRIEDVRE